MDQETGSAQREADRQDALIVEIAALAGQFATQFARSDEADDVAEEVVLECLELIRGNAWPAVKSLPSFVNRIVARRVFDHAEREQNSVDRDAEYGPALHPSNFGRLSPLEELEAAEVMAACREALAHVRPAAAAVYVAVRDQGMSTSEAAEALALSANAVRAHLRRAELAIRAELLALGLMPEGTRASEGLLLAAWGHVPAVLRRRAQEARRREEREAQELRKRPRPRRRSAGRLRALTATPESWASGNHSPLMPRLA